MAKLIIAIALTVTVTDACDVFKHGRVSVGVEGMSDKCCSSASTLVDKTMKAAAAAGGHLSPQEEQAAEMQIMTTMISDCCGAQDQGVLSTLMPEEPPEAEAQITQMCAMGGPHGQGKQAFASSSILELLRISPVKRASVKQADFLAKATDINAFAVGDNSKNNYMPGVNGPVFDTPAPQDNRTQSYMDTAKYASIFGFFFLGVVILICWMECKTFCKTVTVFGH